MARRGNTCNTQEYIRRAKRIGSRWNRLLAWVKGRSDGKLRLYGTPLVGDFERQCQWLEKQKQRAAVNQRQAEQDVQEWQRIIEGRRAEYVQTQSEVGEKINELLKQTENIPCKLPSATHRSIAVFFTLMFLGEIFFSIVALIRSGLFSIGAEVVIAIIAAGGLVWLSEIVGRHVRQLPLSPSATQLDRTRHYTTMIVCLVGLAIVLFFVNFLRSVRDQSGTADDTQGVVHWALLAIGISLVLVGIFRSGDHEYSGPKYGLADLERRRSEALKAINYYDTSIKRLTSFCSNLDRIGQSSIQRVFAIYVDQYKRKSMMNTRAAGA